LRAAVEGNLTGRKIGSLLLHLRNVPWLRAHPVEPCAVGWPLLHHRARVLAARGA